jgi:hypothetical protein
MLNGTSRTVVVYYGVSMFDVSTFKIAISGFDLVIEVI